MVLDGMLFYGMVFEGFVFHVVKKYDRGLYAMGQCGMEWGTTTPLGQLQMDQVYMSNGKNLSD